MKVILDIPTKAEQKRAKDTMSDVAKFLGDRRSHARIVVAPQGRGKNETIELSPNIATSLKFILGNIAEGKAIQLITVEENLSTQEAADMLNVSRPFFVKLLEQGKIPFEKVGTHRRVKLKDVQSYQKKQQATRNHNLEFLSNQAQELNIGY